MKFNIKKTDDNIGIRLNGLKKELAKLPEQSVTKLRSLTPIDTGNARNKTRLANRTTIVLDYKYATALESGHSKQAPNGMLTPFFKWLDNQLNIISRKQ
jgi:hypothetical protein